MPASTPLETIVLTSEAAVAARFHQIDQDPKHPCAVRVAEVEAMVHDTQVVFVHASVPDFPATVQRLTNKGFAVVALVDRGDVPTGVAAMQLGAIDCVEWDRIQADDLPRRAWQCFRRQQECREARTSSIPGSDRELVKRNRQLAALNTYAQKLASLPFSKDMFETAVRTMKEVTGSVGVAISTYDPESHSLVVRHVSLSNQARSWIAQLLGKQFEGMRFKVTPEMHDHIVHKAVADLGSFSETTFGKFLPGLSTRIEKALGVEWFKAVSFQDDGQLLGTMVLAGGKDVECPSDGDITAYAGVTTNALKRWLAEQAASGAESRYRLMAENSHDVIWQTTSSGDFTYLSPSASRLLGYPIDQLEGRKVTELVTEESAHLIEQRLRRAVNRMEANDAGPVQLAMVRSDGTPVWVEVVATPTLGPRGELIGFTGVTRNITERRQAQEAIRQSEALFRAFMDQSAEGFCIMDEQGSIVEWSVGLESLTRIRREEAVGHAAPDVFGRQGDEGKRRWIEKSMRKLLSHELDDGGTQRECSWLDEEGQERLVRCRMFPVAVQERVRLGLAMYDVTAIRAAESKRHDMERALQQAAKREAMGRLAGGVAHDFNNLLTAIAANLELAIEAVREGTIPERGLLNAALDATDTASTVTRQLLAFSKRQIVEASPVGMDNLIRQLESVLNRMVGEHIQVCMQLSAPDHRILTDPAQLEQIILNLVLNAAEAMPGGGQVTLLTCVFLAADGYCAAKAHPDAPPKSVRPGEYVILEVIDTGRGMSDEVKRNLFEPFYTTKQKGQHGTGLGLAAMYGAVDQAGGFVEVSSQLGKGSRIRIAWPVLVEAPAATVRKSGLRARLPAGTENHHVRRRRKDDPDGCLSCARAHGLQGTGGFFRRRGARKGQGTRRAHPPADDRCGHARDQRTCLGRAVDAVPSRECRAADLWTHRRHDGATGGGSGRVGVPRQTLYGGSARQARARSAR